MSMFMEIDSVGIDISEMTNMDSLLDVIERDCPDVVILNPLHLGMTSLRGLIPSNVKVVAMQSFVLSREQLESYDGVISIVDDVASVEQVLLRLIDLDDRAEDELTAREKDIVTGIALGQSNKEIADALCISVHTVMTHRKNIVSKLKIRNSAGLTIYAIVNGLISVDDVK